jgi:hypothetical protein
MRRAANVDTVQPEIAAGLTRAGVKIVYLHQLGNSVPDLLCGWRGKNILLECKTGTDKLSDGQSDWHASWPGQVAVVRSFKEAMDAVIGACK